MNILIIGNLGYIGPIVVDFIRKNNPSASISGLDIGYFVGNEITHNILLPEVYLTKQYYYDVRDFPYEILNNYDAVVYLAAISNDPMGNAFEIPTYDINWKSCYSIASECKKRGIKSFVFASSCSVYGLADNAPRNEDSELNPLTTYAKSKIFAEKDLFTLADDNFTITCLRFATACGFSPRLRLDLVLNDFVASAFLNKKINILSNGKPWRPLIHVKDMARAIYWAITRIKQNGGNFLVCNVGSNEWNYQVIELAESVREVIPKVEIFVNTDAPVDNRSYQVDFSKFRTLAKDFYPQTKIKDVIEELVNNFEKFKFAEVNFRNSRYIRLNTLKSLIENNYIDKDLKKIT